MHINLMHISIIFQLAEPEHDILGPTPMNEETLANNNTDSQDVTISVVSISYLISCLIYYIYIYIYRLF